LRHRLTYLSALSVLTALGWGYIFQGDYCSGGRFWQFLSFRHVKRKRMVKNLAGDR
jgi:membrane protein involved in D-alanine export